MEFEELERIWKGIDERVQQNSRINRNLVSEIVKIKHRERISNALNYEVLASVLLIIGVIVIAFNINLFDTTPLQISVVVTILIMTIQPILTLSTMRNLKNLRMDEYNIRETIIEHTKRSKSFHFAQRLGVGLSFILMLSVIPVTLRISSGQDFFAGENNNVLWFLPVAAIALITFSKWVLDCYKRITNETRNSLKELEKQLNEN
ncbi:MAG: hypothetical protein Tsb0034_08370 [Ekhidna sp.]